jgi:hypothetical protein
MDKWRGIHKLQEEMGEVLQLLGKVGAFPVEEHPDGGGCLKVRLECEIADLEAALSYFKMVNHIRTYRSRRLDKYRQFVAWGLSGIKT